MKLSPRLRTAAIIVTGAVVADQITKLIARAMLRDLGTVQVLGRLVVLRYAENRGAFLSLGATWPGWIRALAFGAFSLALVVIAALYLIRGKGLSSSGSAALALIVGGGIGNLVDRFVRQGSVTDFVNIGIGTLRTGIFNFADVFLVAGVVWFLIAGFWGGDERKERNDT